MNLHDYDLTTRAEEAGIEKGKEMGRDEKAIEVAKNLLRMNKLSHEEIAQAENLPLKKVQELAEEIATEKERNFSKES